MSAEVTPARTANFSNGQLKGLSSEPRPEQAENLSRTDALNFRPTDKLPDTIITTVEQHTVIANGKVIVEASLVDSMLSEEGVTSARVLEPNSHKKIALIRKLESRYQDEDLDNVGTDGPLKFEENKRNEPQERVMDIEENNDR